MRKQIARMMAAVLAAVVMTRLPVLAVGSSAAGEKAAPKTEEAAAEESGKLSLRLRNRSIQDWNESLLRYNYIGRYQFIELSDACAAQYPELAEKLRLMNKGQERYLQDSAEGMIEYAGRFDQEHAAALPLTESSSYLVRRADASALSILERYDLYAGGEESTAYYTYCFDPETGKDLELSEIVQDPSALPDLIADRMMAQMDTADQNPEEESARTPEEIRTGLLGELHEYFETPDQVLQWVLDPHGLTFVFNPHTVDVEREDPLFVTILFRDDPDHEIFCDGVAAEKTYAVYLPLSVMNCADLRGSTDLLKVDAVADETEHFRYRGAEITLNGEHYFDSVYCEELTPVLVQAQSVTCLFLFYETGEGGRIRWSSLNQGSPMLVDEMQGTLKLDDDIQLDWEVEDTVPQKVLTDPERMNIRSMVWLLSSYYGWNEYNLNRDGSLSAANPYYWISGNRLTLKKDLKVPLIDENTMEPTGRRVTVTKGTELIMKDSDGETFVDFELPDGRLIRVEVELGEYGEERVDGEDAYDVFDGMLYAG